MIQIIDINNFDVGNLVITVGTFDGLHKGHKSIINALKAKAKTLNSKSVVFTFWPHPRFVLGKTDNLELLNTIQEKAQLLNELGVDYLLTVNFTKEFSEQTSHEFVKNVLVNKLKIKHLVLGYDHHFGKNREGSFEKLAECAKEFNFTIEQVLAFNNCGENISSTKIRNALKIGDIEKANLFLGYNYFLSGKVVVGQALGRKIGFPTANLELENYKLIPSVGVYAVNIFHNNIKYLGMLNIGYKPTINSENKLSIEVNIFNFNKTIYGEIVKIEFLKKIRDEIKFNNIKELENKLVDDKNIISNLKF